MFLNAKNKMHRVTKEISPTEIVFKIVKQINRAEICFYHIK